MFHLSYSSEAVVRLDCQILLKSPPLTLLAGSVPGGTGIQDIENLVK